VITLVGGYEVSPELGEMSTKRVESGFLTEEQLGILLIRDKPRAIVFSSDLFDSYPAFTKCLDTYLEKTSLDGERRIYWLIEERINRGLANCLRSRE
jgi:hypothetical protein